MGTFSIWHWLIVLAVVLVLFGGGGKISRLMGDFGKGLKSFKKSMAEDDSDSAPESKPSKTIEHEKSETVSERESEKDKAGG